MKLRSSMTLFSVVAPDTTLYRQVIDHFYGGQIDPVTLARL